MGLLAVKHLDPVVGIDVHSVLVAPSPTPVFLPHPHVGFMLDLREYVEAAKGVVGSIAMAIVQEKVSEYLEDHPDVVKKLDDAAEFASGKLTDIQVNAIVAEGLKLEQQAAALQSSIGSVLGAGVGMGGAAGRPIFVNGLMRATVGTHSYHVPGLHFPLGESFAPPPAPDPIPSDDAESYMGSRTVLANNDPMSFMALPALSCWSIGMEPPDHNSAHTERTYPSMPSSVMLPIPAGRPVMVGGPPVLNMAAAAKGLFKAFQGSKWAKALADKLNLKSGFLRCKVLDAEPVDSTTGEVIVHQHDFTVTGRLPLVWDRYYASHDKHSGAVGIGWRTPADIRLELTRNGDSAGVAAYFPDHATAFDAMPDAPGWAAHVHDWQYGHALYRRDAWLVLRTRTGIEHVFALPAGWQRAVTELVENAALALPLNRMTDRHGNAWAYEYGPESSLVRVVEWKGEEASGRVIECDTHAGQLAALTLVDSEGHGHPIVRYEHDRNRDLVSALDAMGQAHRFAYADDHRMVRHTSPRGISFSYSYRPYRDGVWRVERAWGEDGLFDYRFAYDIDHRETRITDSIGNLTILQTNERGLPVVRIDPLGGVTSYRYDAHGRTNGVTDPAARTSTWEYDAYGNLLGHTFSDGSAVRAEYDADHRPVCLTAPGDRQWRYAWDEHGKLIEQTTPGHASSRYDYNRHGQLASHTGPRGAVTHFDYDRDGNLAEIADALGRRTRYLHDARANIIQTVSAMGQVSCYEYDRNGNLTRAIEPGGQEIRCTYDADGNLTHFRDPNGQLTQLEYGALGQISKRVAPDGGVVEYRCDTEQRLIGVANERGELYRFKRDAVGRIVEETDYWGQTRCYRYGISGELLHSVDPLGQAIEYRYDRSGRLVQKRATTPGHDDGVRTDSFAYGPHGDLVLARNPAGRVEFCYDADGWVIEERQSDDTQGDIFTIASTYDASGNRIERKTRLAAGGEVVEHVVRYEYDTLNAVTSIRIDDAPPVVLERDSLGRIRTEHLGTDLWRELSHEAGGQLASQTLRTATDVLFACEYVHDANGEMVERRTAHDNVEQFHYDPMGRLTTHLDPGGRLRRLLRDSTGDLLKTRVCERRTAIGSNATQWVREGEFDGHYLAYDRVGNLIRRHDATQDLTLRWDAAGQLEETVAIRSAAADMAGTQARIQARYEYDPFQRRVRKTVHVGPAGKEDPLQPFRTSRFFWDGNALVGEYTTGDGKPGDPAGQTPARAFAREWVYYPETFRPLATVHCDWTADVASARTSGHALPHSRAAYLFLNDPNGAPVRLHDLQGGRVWETRYGPTGGAEACVSAQAMTQPLRLQGQYFDEESRLQYNRYRYYDPATGSFVSQDPIGLKGGQNPYMYAPNPYSWIDPLGTDCKSDFRKWALEKIWTEANHPLRFLLARDAQGNELKAFTRPPSRKHEDLINWANGPTIEAGHVTSKHSGEPERLGLQDAWENQMDNWFGEKHGVIVTRHGIIEIGGVPVHTRSAEEWELYGHLPTGTVANAPKSIGWAPP
ncbi:RHS repeat-associated core domain-containing protein [Burkholderia sp. IT-111MI5]|uniref:RHS repeat-associated core domain-containing protein n=1 Tax=Burkholderia sp. IT-111MI5 TaxID=3026439 RepID=UPI0039E0C6C8